MSTNTQETILYQGKMFEIVQQNIGKYVFEIARRAPGTRLLIPKDGKILLTKERRHEYNTYDYRLPGGKVFDSLSEYSEKLKNNEDIFNYAKSAVKKECKEETGLTPITLRHLTTSKAGATVGRDLYYFIVDEFKENEQGQELEEGENIEVERKTYEEVKQLCLSGDIKEERTVGVLLRFLLQ